MAEKFVIKAEKREERGKNHSRRLRSQGKLPVIVYGGDDDNLAVTVELSDLAAILRSDTGQNTVFSLDVEGVGASDVMFQDRQIDPLKGRLIHADLRRIRRGEKIEVTVPVHLVGEAPGAEEGGVLTQQMREIKVLCTPSKIPESIEVDVSEMQLNDSIHVSDLKVGEDVEIHEDPEAMVASVIFVKEPELEPTPEEELEQPELVGEEGEAEEGGEGGETEEQ
ncbi:MAG: 50S ribosomal protein L25/general stress protein Ctc [Pyrinomonadaceae bacterium]